MSTLHRRRSRIGVACVTGLALIVGPLLMVGAPAAANTAGTGIVINEAYLNGGSTGATYLNKFIELYNPTNADYDLSSTSLQYRPANGSANPSSVLALTGSIPAGGHYLIQGSNNSTNGALLPTADASTGVSFAGGSGTLFLVKSTTSLQAPPTGSLLGDDRILDLVGYGSSNTFETAPATGNSVTLSLNRTNGADTDSNAADLVAEAPTPTNARGETVAPTPTATPTPTPTSTPTTPPVGTTPVAATIAEIQGTTATSPLAGQTVTTSGIVTASYASGGFNGYVIQTPGTGGAIDITDHAASDAVFVFSAATVDQATIGLTVEVTGQVSEYQGLTEITVDAGGLTPLEDAAAVEPATIAFPTDPAQRESLESMLIAPQGDFTVTDNYDTNLHGSIALTAGTTPLIQPTTVVEPGSAEFRAMMAENAAAVVTLDDGASTNFNSPVNKGLPVPYLSNSAPVRIGAAVSFTKSVIVDYRFGGWNFQPLSELTPASAGTVQPAEFSDTRTAAPAPVGGEATLASFNVLNYFTTTGDELSGCTFSKDRDGVPVTVSGGCDAKGAASQASLERQQAKIVAAINSLDADDVSLSEIENSLALGDSNRDASLAELTTALNNAAGSTLWAFVPSPATLPVSEDVIRTAFIYKLDTIQPVGASVIYDDPAFVNARQPLAQAFQLVGGDASNGFLAIANHFKSKGSGSGTGNVDSGDGQGNSNADRIKQARALVTFADSMKASSGFERVLLSGDFNSYLKEDPIDVLANAGYVSLGAGSGKETYAYDGMIGSLDHIFANVSAAASVASTDIWNVNSVESVALEYSRFNNNVTNFYQPDAYRSSDHDPLVVGLNLASAPMVDVNLMSINDFHGRIDSNTVKFAATIESIRAQYGDDSSALISAGDNIGASLFASSSQADKPTIDVLNALDLTASAVGNHEFDAGFGNLTGRVADEANWNYLGANVYEKGTTTPALPEYEIVMVSGLRVAVIGAVTQETPALVSPDGISSLDFGNPVEAVNRVVAKLTADDLADVYVAQYHEGAGAGTPENATLDEELGLSASAFTDIVTNTSPEVDAIFTGHTHKVYSWDAQIPGAPIGDTRPVLQTGSYGENIGQVILTVDTADDSVEAYTARNIPRIVNSTTEPVVNDATLVAEYPRVAEVKAIVDNAIAAAAVIGNQPIGSVTADITTAFTRPTSGPAARDDRSSESALGNLVANALVTTLKPELLGGAEIGVVNPGGLRADLGFAASGAEGDGVVTYAEANAVLPFVNNLGTTTLTGAQFTTVLEQQWQTNADGTIPTRPFLNLGLSDNVNYTYDATRATGDRITSVTIDGLPIDAAREYRIGTFSFLLAGGDNFREFTSGTNTTDSGLIDRDGWISYITANSPLSPSFDRRGVSVTGIPASALELGATATVQLDKLDLTSTGSPVNTSVSAVFEGSAAAAQTSEVTTGSATVAFTVPADVVGTTRLVITASPSNTVVRVPITVNAIVVPPVDPPTADVTEAAGIDSLTAEVEGLITLSDPTVEQGQSIDVYVGTQYAGQRVYAFLYSTPMALGSSIVSSAGYVQVLIPANAPVGAHRLAIQDASGAVIGWANITISAPTTAGAGVGGSNLAKTGSELAPLIVGAMLLLTLGGALVLIRGRRSLYTDGSEA